jgi:hypothetical protein
MDGRKYIHLYLVIALMYFVALAQQNSHFPLINNVRKVILALNLAAIGRIFFSQPNRSTYIEQLFFYYQQYSIFHRRLSTLYSTS